MGHHLLLPDRLSIDWKDDPAFFLLLASMALLASAIAIVASAGKF